MQFHRRLGIFIYGFWDWFSALLAWILLFSYRKFFIEGNTFDLQLLITDTNFFLGITLIPLGWLALYYFTGTYTDIYRKSRLKEFFNTFFLTLIGVLFLFFTVLIDDIVGYDFTNYYRMILMLFFSHFFLTYFGRLTLLNIAKRQLHKGKVGYNTIIIGGNQSALELYEFFKNSPKSFGYRFLGFLESNGKRQTVLSDHMKCIGHINDLESIMENYKVDDIIIAVDTSDHERISKIMGTLYKNNVVIRIIPDLYDILAGSVKMNNVLGAPLVELYPDLMPFHERILKRLIDVAVSFTALTLLSPFLLIFAIKVRLSSPGQIFYRQERIGISGKPFTIYKFRSMYLDAEQGGPALSSENDDRITPWGKTMRKWRFDEFPQFWNVLKGDMSLVGPRPERKFFIDQIVQTAPEYKYLQKVKPGITSLGMVKFGYAENVGQMIERMKYDLLYIENMSLLIDFKIMAYTVITLVQGKGK